jgi:primosomal protein N'
MPETPKCRVCDGALIMLETEHAMGPHCGSCGYKLVSTICEECPNCGSTAITNRPEFRTKARCTKCGNESSIGGVRI